MAVCACVHNVAIFIHFVKRVVYCEREFKRGIQSVQRYSVRLVPRRAFNTHIAMNMKGLNTGTCTTLINMQGCGLRDMVEVYLLWNNRSYNM